MASPTDRLWFPLRDAAERAGIREFLRWWLGELAAALPASWRERLIPAGAAFVMVDAADWKVVQPSSGRLLETGRIPTASPDPGSRRAEFARLVGDSSGGSMNVWLVLSDESVLARRVTLPLAAEESIRDAVGFELDRFSPFSQEHACFDFRIAGRDTAAQRLELELVVAARAEVFGRVQNLRELGATVVGVGAAGDVAASSMPLNLLAPEDRERPAPPRTAAMAKLLAGMTAILLLVSLGYPIWRKREAVIDLAPRLESAKASADVADRLTKEIERLAHEHNFLLARKQALVPTVTLLEELSGLMPDTTWVQQLDVKSGPKTRELQMAGETGSSSQMIELLERSSSLANASFKSPLTKGATPGTERFLIAAEVKARPLPDPVPEAALKSLAPGESTAATTPPAAAAPLPASSPAAKAPETPTPAKPLP